MRAVDIIRKKRDGQKLDPTEIGFMIDGVLSGKVPDYQLTAWLMAIWLRGMDDEETAVLTQAIIRSGTVLDLAHIPGVKVDKHSTGGVGDKTSLILAPIVAAAGVIVPMISGRGLGHTGGTLDKLESIPGFRADLSADQFQEILQDIGVALIGQTSQLAPADKQLYALRDVTATVESIPLIVASIMGKKIAEGIDALVLDVKTGEGAFMTRVEDARRLAQMMVATGKRLGKKVVALLTRMDEPLGRNVGNALEVQECVEVLKGRAWGDLAELSLELSAWMLYLGQAAPSVAEARRQAQETLSSGRAFEKFKQVVARQGGDVSAIEDPGRLPRAAHQVDYRARRAGVVTRVHARPLGEAAMLLGAGRETADSLIDPAVGVCLLKKCGDWVDRDQPLCRIYYNELSRWQRVASRFDSIFEIGESPVEQQPLVVDVIQ